MLLKLSVIVMTILACYMLTGEAANVRFGGANQREDMRQNDKMASSTGLQPFAVMGLQSANSPGSSSIDPMSTAASYHHHKGSKGWLDMGAWTKKKGAFGWYADFPVGKGK